MSNKKQLSKIKAEKQLNTNQTAGIFNFFDNLVNKHSKWLLGIFVTTTILFSILLFDVKLSIGADDSYYILRAYDFIKQGIFPTFQGPLYPIILSLPVSIWGINVPLLKAISILFMTLHVYLFFITFKNRIPGFVLFFATLFISLHPALLYYSSQTYTEAFYFFIQSALVYVFINFHDSYIATSFTTIKKDFKKWLLFGLIITACVLTKNVAFGLLGGFIAYFLLNKKWIPALLVVVSLLVFYIPFEVSKKIIWKVNSVQTEAQGKILLYKDPYDFSKGKEDLSGFIARVFDNADIYLSKHLLHLYHLKKYEDIEVNKGSTFLIVLLLLIGLIAAYKKKNHSLVFISLITFSGLFIIFLVLQTRWDSERLFIITVPYIVLIHLYALYSIFNNDVTKNLQIVPIIIVGVLSVVLLKDVITASSKNYKILKRNLAGDKYYGYTDDYRNMLILSEWCGKNLPDSAYVMSRKAGMSRIYANGKKFYEIYKVPSTDPDTLLDILYKNKVTHILHASLRRNPAVNDGQIITTTYNYLAIILNKYPNKFKLIQTVGDVEPAYLYELEK
jgi:hypothetical protein